MILNVHLFSRQVLVRVYWNLTVYRNLIVLNRYSNNIQISNLIKIRPVESESLHADGQTDVTKLIVYLPNFTNSPTNVLQGLHFTHLVHRVHSNVPKVSIMIFFHFPWHWHCGCCAKHNYGAGDVELKAVNNFIFCWPCISVRFLLTTSLTHFLQCMYEGWNFNSGNYLFTTDTK